MPSANRPHLLLAGGSGFLGQSLLPHLLSTTASVTLLTRGPDRPPTAANPHLSHVHWDAKTPGPWIKHLRNTDAVINLVGRTVDCRKTPAHKREILESRVNSVRALADAFNQINHFPRVWLQSATAHIYGDTADELLDDASPLGTGFAPDVGRAWEQTLTDAHLPPTRRVLLRISFVLGRNGGALQTLARLTRLFLGGAAGTGRQYISWIHEADLSALFLRALTDDTMQGPYLATAPTPVTNAEFMRELRSTLRRPWSPPIPAPLVRLGALVLRTDPELALLGRRCVPSHLLQEGFTFQFPTLRPALHDLLRRQNPPPPAP